MQTQNSSRPTGQGESANRDPDIHSEREESQLTEQDHTSSTSTSTDLPALQQGGAGDSQYANDAEEQHPSDAAQRRRSVTASEGISVTHSGRHSPIQPIIVSGNQPEIERVQSPAPELEGRLPRQSTPSPFPGHHQTSEAPSLNPIGPASDNRALAQTLNEGFVSLAQALADTVKSRQDSPITVEHSDSGPKLRKPDRFDGKDRSKLRSFLAQVRLAIQGAPKKFRTEKQKTFYAGTYLEDTPFDWFQNLLIDDDENWILEDYEAFEKELKRQFGDPDKRATAERKLRQLKMRDTHEVQRYIVEFRRYTPIVGWNNCALVAQFRQGLPDRILDELARRDDEVDDLVDLQRVVTRIDQRHWERQNERKERTDHKSVPAGHNSSSASSAHRPDRSKNNSRPNNFNRSTNSPAPFNRDRGNNSRPSRGNQSSSKPLPLGPDGKLLPAERERRISQGLCAYHGIRHPDGKCVRVSDSRPPVANPQGKINVAVSTEAPASDNSRQQRTSYFQYAQSRTSDRPGRINVIASIVSNNDDDSTDQAVPECIVTVHINDVACTALVDSGATASYISSRTLARLGGAVRVRSLAKPINTRLFDGSKVEVAQSADTVVKFGEGSYHDCGFLVSPETSEYDIIIGVTLLRQLNPTLNWETGSITFPPSSAKSDELRMLSTTRALRQWSIGKMNLAVEDPGDEEPSTEELSKLEEVVPKAYHKYLDVFSESQAAALPPHRDYDLKIDLVDNATPPFGPLYQLAAPEQATLREYLDKMLTKGYIRASTSPAAAPVLFVPKNDKTLRLCVDYCRLNNMTIKNRYPLPLIDSLLGQLSEAKIFTKIDLRSAYNLVRVAEGHEWKTAFRTRYGLYEYLVMPFGLTNAPSVFQRFINDVLRGEVDRFCIVYLDNILVYSANVDEHSQHVCTILERLRVASLYANASKCEFHLNRVEYLGYIVTPDGLSMDHSKVETIVAWPEPNNVRAVQSFLGFANFYRRFIKNYSAIAKLSRMAVGTRGYRWNALGPLDSGSRLPTCISSASRSLYL